MYKFYQKSSDNNLIESILKINELNWTK